MNKVCLLQNVRLISRILYPRNYSLITRTKQYLSHHEYIISSYFNIPCFKYISNCTSVQKKDTDTRSDKYGSEKVHKVLEDEEFQNILKDFANDFGVDKESSELLEDIRKNIDDDHKDNKICQRTNNSNYDLASSSLAGGLSHTYKEFSDADSSVIPSYEDDVEGDEQVYHIDQELKPKPFGYLERGVTGVFNIEDLVQVLRNESLIDITAIKMLTEDKDCSCDFIVLVTARSERHAEAVSENILKLYKRIKNKKDPFVTVQGTGDSGWKVIDMGNIILHIFLEEVRAKYDIESCQLLDLEYDSGGDLKPDPMLKVIAEQMEFFNSLKHQTSSSEITKDGS